MSKVIKISLVVVLAIALAFAMWQLLTMWSSIKVYVPLARPIDNAVEVGNLENKFIHVESVGFGGAGAGGIGAPIVHAATPEQFVSLVAHDEPIYSAFTFGEYHGRRDSTICGLTYWAFLENRAGVVQYQDMYNGSHISVGTYCKGLVGDSILFELRTETKWQVNKVEDYAISRGYRYEREDH